MMNQETERHAQAIRERIEVILNDAEHNEYPRMKLAASIHGPKAVFIAGYMIGIKDALEIITGERE